MKKWILVLFFAVAVMSLSIVRYGAFAHAGSGRTNPPLVPTEPLEANPRLPPEVGAVLDRACRDCHTSRTVWPWYSTIPPVSWMVLDHVNHGRSHLNFSTWASYSREEKTRLLENTCKLVSEGAMPLPSYLWIHEESRLSDGDVKALCEWTREERERLNLK